MKKFLMIAKALLWVVLAYTVMAPLLLVGWAAGVVWTSLVAGFLHGKQFTLGCGGIQAEKWRAEFGD